jgi:hypothetical protein
MISDAKQSIIIKLQELYPTGYTIYDEEIPESFSKPSFYLTLVNQNYNRRRNNHYTSLLSFDLAYYSNSSELRTDCLRVQLNLLRTFDLLDKFHVINKNAKIINNVLHVTFDIRYTEMTEGDEVIPMQQQHINTIL